MGEARQARRRKGWNNPFSDQARQDVVCGWIKNTKAVKHRKT